MQPTARPSNDEVNPEIKNDNSNDRTENSVLSLQQAEKEALEIVEEAVKKK